MVSLIVLYLFPSMFCTLIQKFCLMKAVIMQLLVHKQTNTHRVRHAYITKDINHDKPSSICQPLIISSPPPTTTTNAYTYSQLPLHFLAKWSFGIILELMAFSF